MVLLTIQKHKQLEVCSYTFTIVIIFDKQYDDMSWLHYMKYIESIQDNQNKKMPGWLVHLICKDKSSLFWTLTRNKY